MTHKTRIIAVLTGDIVGSTALGPEKLERAFDALRDCAEMQAEWMGKSLHFTRHRGDGWQVALAEPKYALRSAILFRSCLKSLGKEFDTYIGIADGKASKEISTDLNKETAGVFIISGQELEFIKKGKCIGRMHFTRSHPSEPFALLYDLIIESWTSVQAATMYKYLSSPTSGFIISDLADALKKSRQTVSKTLKSAGYEHINEALLLMEMKATNV
ncbi:hypothetical protein [Pacificibacter marinus]|uniref:Uncharacterized protein n=1 Tax=Pacificibacter marinus TaxID=658057 RepID=A0A1Y5RSX9_9RHOB|nr:hypothetical protein [Pacificibacter marinus]SEK41497.1 hypothetical protein SAMN04488032_102252 [Pacificibacter marinus]SLN24734.1 hypothetical protein PAM7971_00834 [Pacificibacter marinus]